MVQGHQHRKQLWYRVINTENNYGTGSSTQKTIMVQGHQHRKQLWYRVINTENNYGTGSSTQKTIMVQGHQHRKQLWYRVINIKNSHSIHYYGKGSTVQNFNDLWILGGSTVYSTAFKVEMHHWYHIAGYCALFHKFLLCPVSV